MIAGICAYQNVISWDSIGALYPQKANHLQKSRNRHSTKNPFKALKIQGSRSTVPDLWNGSVSEQLPQCILLRSPFRQRLVELNQPALMRVCSIISAMSNPQ
jgi:hypothetical protein